jgi:hypothetical protein
LLLALVVAALASVSPASAAIEPPWCGTPEPDAAAALPSNPPLNFPHIPYYAIKCTLDSIAAESNGRMTVEVIGRSAGGRELYLVTINALDTVQQRQDFHTWEEIRRVALTDPFRAQDLLHARGDGVKVPLYVQAGIHGNEYEGVDSSMQIIERLATTPYGEDPEVDAILDHSVVLFNIVQNPDGRIAGTRTNGNGFDLNRDFLTQSQPETQASVQVMQDWLPPEVLDLHGYLTPVMLIEATTKPHNPSIEYDLWLKWNQGRIDANEAALGAAGYGVQRPINDWCEDADLPPPSGICPGGTPPGPAVAEGWDDWGPFYTPMYAQHIGLNGSTVEMCNTVACGGRVGSREQQYITTWSTLLYDIENRAELLSDELEIYKRAVVNAPRPACCPAPFDVDNNWMTEYPQAYVIPVGAGQRSSPEANRLVEWLLANGILVEELKQNHAFGGQTFESGSYVVWMSQARRGLADTALSIGVDVSPRINILYAPPAAWSHGYLWGADVVTIPRGASFAPRTNVVFKPSAVPGGVEPGPARNYALEIDSATAVRTLNELVDRGFSVQLALAPVATPAGDAVPAGSVIFSGDPATKIALAEAGREKGLRFRRVADPLPALEPVERVPQIAVLTTALNQDVWVLRNLGFRADAVATGATSPLNNPAAPDPLAGYDVVFSTAGWPSGATARARLTAFFNAGGGFLGAGSGGASFIGSSGAGQFSGLTAATASGGGQSGIVYWNNMGGAASPIVGAYPSRDTAIQDPPTWFTAVPASATVDARFPEANYFAAGLWRSAARAATVPNAPLIVHGASTAAGSNARIVNFAMNPLYRADPEREWPLVGTAAYWADR